MYLYRVVMLLVGVCCYLDYIGTGVSSLCLVSDGRTVAEED